MVNALKLQHPSCRISTFTANSAIAVCSAKVNCPKRYKKYQLELGCFMDKTEELEWCSYSEKL